jgi:hypothetical protein
MLTALLIKMVDESQAHNSYLAVVLKIPTRYPLTFIDEYLSRL